MIIKPYNYKSYSLNDAFAHCRETTIKNSAIVESTIHNIEKKYLLEGSKYITEDFDIKKMVKTAIDSIVAFFKKIWGIIDNFITKIKVMITEFLSKHKDLKKTYDKYKKVTDDELKDYIKGNDTLYGKDVEVYIKGKVTPYDEKTATVPSKMVDPEEIRKFIEKRKEEFDKSYVEKPLYEAIGYIRPTIDDVVFGYKRQVDDIDRLKKSYNKRYESQVKLIKTGDDSDKIKEDMRRINGSHGLMTYMLNRVLKYSLTSYRNSLLLVNTIIKAGKELEKGKK